MAFSNFERRRRAASRTALYVSFALAAIFLGWLVRDLSTGLQLDTEWYWTDWASMEEVQLLREYVAIDTVAGHGREIEGARWLESQLRPLGVEVHVEELAGGHANLWAILEGEDPQALVLHHHIDVEKIHKPELWRFDPFGATLEPPFLYGRGVFDMKSVAIAQLLAFRDVARRAAETGEKPQRSLIFLATSSEEVGSDLGTQWVLRQHPELVERFWAVLTEGGLLEIRNRESLKFWGIEFANKRFADLIVCSEHKERLEALREELLGDTGQSITDLRLTEPVRTFLEGYWQSRDDPELGEKLRVILDDPAVLQRDPALFVSLPRYVQAFFRDEVAPFPILPVNEVEGGRGAEGVEGVEGSDHLWRMKIKLHMLPGSTPEDVRHRLVPDYLLHGLDVHGPYPEPLAPASPVDHPLFVETARVLKQHSPDTDVGPVWLPWTTTDSRFFREAGIPSYGVSPFIIFTSDSIHVGGTNERVSLPGYVDGVTLYRELVQRIAHTSAS